RQGETGREYVIAWAGETITGRDITLTQHDVRQVQLAKAALYVAARTLLDQLGLERPDKLILAGGFGSTIDKTKAMLIGMIPDMPLENVYSVGNAAGDGARIALLNVEKRREAAVVARLVRRYELPADSAFQNRFMLALNLPHMTDPFEHVAHLLPAHQADPMAGKLRRGDGASSCGGKRRRISFQRRTKEPLLRHRSFASRTQVLRCPFTAFRVAAQDDPVDGQNDTWQRSNDEQIPGTAGGGGDPCGGWSDRHQPAEDGPQARHAARRPGLR
ncbi:MAG: ASKHA domain-containing protein, partial [Bacteroidota bacterium]